MSKPVCILEDVEMSLGPGFTLGPISLSLHSGEICGIVGSNGAGKSTLVQLIAGVYLPTRGRITREKGLVVGYAPQEIALYESMTCRQNLLYWGEVYGLPHKANLARTAWLLESLKLEDKARVKLSYCSGGMKRRMNFAAAMMATPKLLLLDEPTAGADEDSAKLILESIIRTKNKGAAVVFISHSHAETEAVCDRAITLDKGRISSETVVQTK